MVLVQINVREKKAGHKMAMAVVREPCNIDAHAKIPDIFMTMVCPRLCVHIASIQGTPHMTHTRHTQTKSNVELGFPD